MKYIIKMLFIFTFIFSFYQIKTIYWEENPIDNISYQWYLTWNTIIEINGDLENCDLISISWKKINEYQKNNNNINFEFDKLNLYNWTILLNCNWKTYKKEFSFPYISNYRISLTNNFKNIIEIEWENFNDIPNVFIWNKRLRIINTNNNRYIIAYLSEDINNNELYIANWNIKSNLIKLNIEIPEIIKIKSDNLFKIWSTLKIYTKNFNFSPNNFIIINDTDKYQILEKNYKNDYFVFKLPNKYIWENNISIVKDSIKSNPVTFKIFSEIPIIKQITSWLDKDWKKILKIKWENFINTEKLKVKVWKNWYTLKIKSINNEEIIIYTDSKIQRWHNYIYIELEWNISNIYDYYIPWDKTPSIWSITTEWLTPDNKYRIFRLTTNYFNKKTDWLLLNDRYLKNFWYYWNIIKAQIPKNTVKWYFGFNRNWKKLNYLKSFDFSYQFSPIINYINIKWDFKYWTKVEIVWKNFLLAKISANNLLGKNNDWKYDISISNSKIIWYLPKNFDQNKNSSITITNNWINNNLSFKLNKINKKRINWNFILEKITNDSWNFIIKQGDTINVFWSYFHQNDTIFLNDEKINFKYINPTQIKIQLSKDIIPWKYKLKIINNIWIETILNDLVIYEKNSNPKINFIQEKTDEIIKVNPLTGNTEKDFNIKYNIKNNFSLLQINKIIFKVKNYKKDLYLWNFELSLNWNFISNSVIKDNWELIFNIPFVIRKNLNQVQQLSLEKNNWFIKEWEFNIILEKIEWVLLINWEEKDISQNIKIENLNNTYKIEFKDIKSYNCINIEWDFFDCLDNKNKKEQNVELQKFDNKKIFYLKKLVNARHKLNKTNKWNNYIKQIDFIVYKYSKKENTLKNLLSKIKKAKEKIKNKKWIKYLTFNNILDYLEAKIQLQLIKNKEK